MIYQQGYLCDRYLSNKIFLTGWKVHLGLALKLEIWIHVVSLTYKHVMKEKQRTKNVQMLCFFPVNSDFGSWTQNIPIFTKREKTTCLSC